MKFVCITVVILNLLLFCNNNVIAKPKLRWAAFSEGLAPFVFQDPKNPQNIIGFEVDIIKEICNEIGFEPVFIQNQWEDLISGVEQGDYDVAINGIEITNESKFGVCFSKPYYTSFAQIVVLGDNKNINSFSDLVSKKVGTMSGTNTEKILITNGTIDLKTYDSESSSFLDLLNSKIDAILIDKAIALYFITEYSNYKMVGKPFGEINYGIVIKKDNLILLDKINNAILKLQNNGKLRKILESWNLWNHLMAKRLNDTSVAKVKSSNYEYFINSHSAEKTFMDKIKRYFYFFLKMFKF